MHLYVELIYVCSVKSFEEKIVVSSLEAGVSRYLSKAKKITCLNHFMADKIGLV